MFEKNGSYDPRLVDTEILGVDLLIADEPLPCRQDICSPLEPLCLEVGTDRSQAVISCGRLIATRMLEKTTVKHEELIAELSVDQDTGILSRNALWALFEDLNQRKLLEDMATKGYTCQLIVSDVNKLKLHNELGGHDGGDAALQAVASQIKGLFRREQDVVGLLEHRQEADVAISGSDEFCSVSRFEVGDEMLVMSFIPPANDNNPPDLGKEQREYGADSQRMRIDEAFDGLTVTYSLREDITPQLLDKVQKGGVGFDLVDGQACVAVGITFAVVSCPIPTSKTELLALRKIADHEVMRLKDVGGYGSIGSVIDLLDNDTRV